jgi:ATP/maltotriose-dependent transcriptional regulator MalT
MKRHILLYGLIGGILIAALKWMEYRFLVIEHSVEIYGGLIAATFAVLGIWLGLTPRELEILQLIAQGMSNREIAEKLFVSENTVKTHSSRVFDKLGAKRRTQAVQFGKEFRLIP